MVNHWNWLDDSPPLNKFNRNFIIIVDTCANDSQNRTANKKYCCFVYFIEFEELQRSHTGIIAA